MKQIFKNLLATVMTILGIAVCWQGMNEIYKFDDADYTDVFISFFTAFIILFQMFNVISTKPE